MFSISRLISLNFVIGFLIIVGVSFGISNINEKLDRIEKLEYILSESQAQTAETVSELSNRIEKLENRVLKRRANINISYTNERIKYTSLDVFCLAKNIYHEARGQGDLGMYAVAQVTINRLYSRNWGSTVCDVVMSPMQFSWANDKSIRWKHPSGQSWEQSKSMAENVLSKGLRIKGLQDALFYHANYVNPRWASERYLIATIGDHIFYKNAL